MEIIDRAGLFFSQEQEIVTQKRDALDKKNETGPEKSPSKERIRNIKNLERNEESLNYYLRLLMVRQRQIFGQIIRAMQDVAQDFYARQQANDSPPPTSKPALKAVAKNQAEITEDMEPVLVIILDEIGEAHPAIFKFLLNVFEEGRVLIRAGEEVSFENAIFILACNVGDKEFSEILKKKEKWLGIAPRAKKRNGEDLEKKIRDVVGKIFPVQFINRLDGIIVFGDLSDEDLSKIIELRLAELAKNLALNFHTLEVEPDAKKHILAKTKEVPEKQARQVDQVLNDLILLPLNDLHEKNPLGQNKMILVKKVNEKVEIEILPKKLLRK